MGAGNGYLWNTEGQYETGGQATLPETNRKSPFEVKHLLFTTGTRDTKAVHGRTFTDQTDIEGRLLRDGSPRKGTTENSLGSEDKILRQISEQQFSTCKFQPSGGGGLTTLSQAAASKTIRNHYYS